MDISITRDVKEERDNRLWEARSHWQHSSEFPSVCTSNGRWLFKNNASCVAMLTQQLRHEDNMHARNEPQYDEEVGIPNAAWLFLSRGADERAMYQVLTRVDIRESRRESRIMHKIYEDDTNIPNAALLFLSRGADERAMLYQVFTRDDIRESRRESRIMNKIYEDDWLDHCSYYEFFRGTYDRMLKFLEDGLAIANERIQEL